MITNEIERMLDKYTAKLAPVAEHAWAVLIRQVYVNAAQEAFVALLLLLGVVLLRWKVWPLAVACDKENGGDPPACFSVVLVMLGCAFVFVGLASSAVGKFVNPAYYAIDLLREVVK